jgi:hypothetical protein
MGELSMEKLHFQAKSTANFVKLGCTILFEKGNRMDDLGAVWHEYFNGLWKKPFRMGALSEKKS